MSFVQLVPAVAGYSSDSEDLAQNKSIDSIDVEYCPNDDVIIGDVDSAQKKPKKPKTFGSELQLHNYFSSSAGVLTAEENFQLAKYSDSSHVMRPTGKSAVFVVSATQQDRERRKNCL